MNEALKLWEFIAGMASFFIGLGLFVGYVKGKFREYDKSVASCHIETLMTEEKCRIVHADRDKVTQLQIAQMQKIIETLELSSRNADQRWGALSEKINIIIDRMDRGNGYAAASK